MAVAVGKNEKNSAAKH